MRFQPLISSILFALSLSGTVCQGQRVLTKDFLLSSNNFASSVPNEEFLPVGNNVHQSQVKIDGFININNFDDTTRHVYTEIWSDPDPSTAFPQPFSVPTRRVLPEFSYQYVQNGDDLLPVTTGVNPNGLASSPNNPYKYILSPSKCWSEAADAPYDRCTVVFAVTESGQNCVYNGLLTFLVHPGTYATSQVWYQVTSTFCGYYQWNNWGFANVQIRKSVHPDKTSIITKFQNWKSNLFPTADILSLPGDVPGATLPSPAWTHDSNPFNYYSDHSDCSPKPWYPATIPFYGVVYNNTLYRSPAGTFTGNHPYPEYFVYPMYSLTKSNYASLLAGALDQNVGCQFPSTPTSTGPATSCIFDLKVADWIPEAGATWNQVTLQHLLDLTSNHYISTAYGVDEGGLAQNINFFYSYTNSQKLAYALSGFPFHNETQIGSTWVYHSTDIYIAGRLMENVIRAVFPSLTGGSVQFYKQYVCAPLKLSDTYCNMLVTEDSDKQPFAAYGMFSYADDIAKIASFWSTSGGQVGSTRVVSSSYFNKAMQLDGSERGLFTGRSADPQSTCYPRSSVRIPIPNQRYHLGFWSDDTMGAGYSGVNTTCVNNKLVFESGYGGIRMMIANQKWAYLQWTDNYDFKVYRATATLANLIGCPVGLFQDS